MQPTFWQRFWCVLFGGHAMRTLMWIRGEPAVVECSECGYRPKGSS
jgi:hypothetical protein